VDIWVAVLCPDNPEFKFMTGFNIFSDKVMPFLSSSSTINETSQLNME